MDDDLRENDSSILDGNGDGASENDPSLSAVRDAEEGGVTPGFLGGNDWVSSGLYKKNDRKLKQDKKKENAAAGLASAEKSASENNLDGANVMKKETSGGSKLFSGSGKKKSSKKGGKRGFAGKIKKSAPILAIVSGMVGAIAMISGSQNLLPIALKEMIVEKLNSVGVSSTIASDDWLNTQLNQGVRMEKLSSGNAENKFAFSSYQVQQFEKFGIKVVGDDDDDQITALLYEKNSQYIPVVGSAALEEYSTSDITNAVRASADVDSIGSPVSAEIALKDDNFKIPYTKASKAWRGGVSGWFDNIMSDITEVKLNVERNRWARFVAKNLKEISEDFKNTASAKVDKTSDKGLSAEQGDAAGDDDDTASTNRVNQDDEYELFEDDTIGETEEVKYDTDGASNEDLEIVRSKNGSTSSTDVSDDIVDVENITSNGGDAAAQSTSSAVGNISKVLNSKAVKAASAISEVGCALLEGLVSIYTVVSAYQNLQFLNLISGFLESVDKVKAGDGSGSPIHEYSTNLTTKADTIDDNGNVAEGREGRTAVESAGVSWLFGKNNSINQNDASVRNVNFENIMSNISVFTSNIRLTSDVYAACGYTKAGMAAVDLATTIISFIPVAGQAIKGVQLGVKEAIKVTVKIVIQVAFYAIVPVVAKNLANMIIKDAATDWFGEDLGNAIVSGAGKYLGGNGTSGGQSPGSMSVVTAYLGARDTVIADGARYQRAVRNPFDITSRHTFLGSMVYSAIPLAYSGGLMTDIVNMAGMISSSVVGAMPAADAVSESNELTSSGSCDLLGSTGAVGDAFCNAYIVTDMSTINTSPIAVNDIVHNLSGDDVIASTGDAYTHVGSGNFDESGKIKKDSNLGKYITYCGQRTSQYGIKDLTIADSIIENDFAKIMGYVPVVNDFTQMYEGIKEEANYDWITGSACVASEENPHWDEYKWYQRYAENERLVENMNPGYTSTVTAYLREYYKENPLDQSFEGTIARFTGMSKEKVEDTLALIDYYEFLNEYNPNERYAFGKPAIEVEKELKFDNGNSVAEQVWGILLGQISYADVRNRSFAA